MNERTSQKTSLEWFFEAPRRANIPQTFASSAMLDLQISFDRFLRAFLGATARVPEDQHPIWLNLWRQGMAFEEKFRQEFTTVEAFELISLLDEIAERCSQSKTLLSDEFKSLWHLFRKVLASLVLCAKESRDASFKNGVLSLVKRWEVA